MRFKRISTDTVRCIVTEDELEANGLAMDDFLSNDGRTEEFLRKMITLAEQETGFKVQGGPMTIQVAVLPENTLALTFSEKQGGNLMELLEGLRSAMSNLSEAVNEKARQRSEQAVIPVEQKDAYLLEFSDIRSLQDFCISLVQGIEEQFQMDSGLYRLRDEGVYCLILQRGAMGEKEVCQIMAASLEFMDAVSAEESQLAYIMEHGECVLPERAITTLQGIAVKRD